MYALVICSTNRVFRFRILPKCILDLTSSNFRIIILDIQNQAPIKRSSKNGDIFIFLIKQLSVREVTLCMQISVIFDFSGADFDNLIFLLQLIAKKLSSESKNLLDAKIDETIESLSFVI